MIRLTCTHCKSTLEMDDAFAGGVCRCQHCGTIQTVPTHAKNTAHPQPSSGKSSTSKSLYKGRTGPAFEAGSSSSSGLDELASAVASSGLGSELTGKEPFIPEGMERPGNGRRGNGLPAASPAPASRGNGNRGQTIAYRTPAAPKKSNQVLILAMVSGGVGLLVVLLLLLYIFIGRSGPVAVSTATGGGASAGTSGGVTPVAGTGGETGSVSSGPRFCDVQLTGQ